MKDNEKTVALKSPDGKTTKFTPAHAKRLLAYPGTVWEELADEKAPKTLAKAAEGK